MKQVEILSTFKEYSSVKELPAADQRLIKEAHKSVSRAYAPYSQFNVGAAVLLANGKIVSGNNQENASYPIGLCAERVALFSASADFPKQKIKAIAVTAKSKDFIISKPVSPCGACRQSIAEYEHRHNHPIRVILTGEKGKVLVADGIKNFLPLMFKVDDLKKR